MNIVQRTHLTTSERAMLSLFLVALSTGGYTAINAIAASGNINWYVVLVVALVTTFATFGHTLATYLTTTGNIPLGTMIEAGTTTVEKRLEPTQPQRQFVVLPPATSLASQVNPIVLPVQTVPHLTQGNTPPPSSDAMGGTTLVPIVPPPPPQ